MQHLEQQKDRTAISAAIETVKASRCEKHWLRPRQATSDCTGLLGRSPLHIHIVDVPERVNSGQYRRVRDATPNRLLTLGFSSTSTDMDKTLRQPS